MSSKICFLIDILFINSFCCNRTRVFESNGIFHGIRKFFFTQCLYTNLNFNNAGKRNFVLNLIVRITLFYLIKALIRSMVWVIKIYKVLADHTVGFSVNKVIAEIMQKMASPWTATNSFIQAILLSAKLFFQFFITSHIYYQILEMNLQMSSKHYCSKYSLRRRITKKTIAKMENPYNFGVKLMRIY